MPQALHSEPFLNLRVALVQKLQTGFGGHRPYAVQLPRLLKGVDCTRHGKYEESSRSGQVPDIVLCVFPPVCMAEGNGADMPNADGHGIRMSRRGHALAS